MQNDGSTIAFTKGDVEYNRWSFAYTLFKHICTFDKEQNRYEFNTNDYNITTWYGGIGKIMYCDKGCNYFIMDIEFTQLFDYFIDPINPTQEELCFFNLEFSCPWITEIKKEDIIKEGEYL